MAWWIELLQGWSSSDGFVDFSWAIAAGDATSADLTGTWEGLLVCDDYRGGEQANFVADDRVEITQSGEGVRLRRVAQDGSRPLIYAGRLAPITDSGRVEALVSVCGGAYVAQEMLRLRRALANADGSGSFDAESLYESTAVPGLEGTLFLGTCKWAYQRVSAEGAELCARVRREGHERELREGGTLACLPS